MFSELERTREEAVVANFKDCRPGGTEKTTKNFSQDSQCPGQDLN